MGGGQTGLRSSTESNGFTSSFKKDSLWMMKMMFAL
jgi:hypothetical protein